MPTILSESLEHTITTWVKKFKLFPILLSFFLVIFTLLFMRDLAARSLVDTVGSQLPYPGIMQDNPLYMIKRLRDDFLILTTRDSMDRALLYRHLADKSVNAAQLSQNCSHALSSAQLSAHYLEDMKASFETAQKMGAKPEILALIQTKRALQEHEKALKNVSVRCGNSRVAPFKGTLRQITKWFSSTFQTQ